MRTSKKTTKNPRVRSFLREAWDDTVRANRAMLRVPPYDDYLQNRRDSYR